MLTQHYKWIGESSTYAHPSAGQAREIIPWLLVERPEGDQRGWYLGIEFSGRTRISLERDGNSVRGRGGLNPRPAPSERDCQPEQASKRQPYFLALMREVRMLPAISCEAGFGKS